jgi:xanthine dehydrogenase YagR molybdenum-binding subunit
LAKSDSPSQVAADVLGVPFEQVRFSLGRSDLQPAPPHGGSLTMASVWSAVRAACIAVQEEAAAHAFCVRSCNVEL